MRAVIAISTSILSGILLCASFPAVDLHFMIWLALVPLFLAIINRRPAYAFLLCFVFSVTFFSGIFYWIFQLRDYRFLHQFVFALYFGPCLGLFGLAFSFISGRRGFMAAFLAAPFLWVSLEYIRSNLSFLALPWGLLAHSQYQNASIIQIASLTGAYGVSFLVVMVNSAIAGMLYPFFWRADKTIQLSHKPFLKQGRVVLSIVAVLSVVIALIYGHVMTSRPVLGEPIKLSVVQGNIEQTKKWDRKYAKFIMQTYNDLTIQVSADRPQLIIWPETATPAAINLNKALYGQVRRIAQKAGSYLLLGSSQQQKFKGEGTKRYEYRNSAFLISPEVGSSKNQRYDKIRLLPFGEYLPLEGTIPWSAINIPDIGGYVSGEEFTVFELRDFRFGVTICWENIFPDLVREFVRRGAQFIVNITNEAWFGRTSAPYQFVPMSVLRAVESRRYVVRCANTGISCFIDPYGRIIDRVKDGKGNDIFVRGVLTGSIIPLESKTFYTRYGDWFAWLCFPCSAAFLLFAFLSKGRDQKLIT